jgi:hypothetical protein
MRNDNGSNNDSNPRFDAAWRDGWLDAFHGGNGQNPFRQTDNPNSCYQHWKAGWLHGNYNFDLDR